MAREFAARQLIRSSQQAVFDFVADYRHVAPVLEGISRWQPISRRTRGVGALYSVEMSALGIPLRDTLELDEWRPPEAIGWHSTGGVMPQTGRWLFTPRPDGVEAELRIRYDPPAGVLGEVVARALDSLVRKRLREALRKMRDLIESGTPVAT